MATITKRHPDRPLSRVALDERAHAERTRTNGRLSNYVIERGERIPLPIDHISRRQDFKGISGLWETDAQGRVFRPGTRMEAPGSINSFQKRALAWARDHIHEDIPYWYYMATLGHDLHVSTWGDLFARHWHIAWANPFTGELVTPIDPAWAPFGAQQSDAMPLGFVEHCGWVSGGKVTTAFVSEEIDELVSATATEYADFDFHEVGTSSAAEANTQTALTTPSGIARVTGTPTDADPIYRNVGTITADATESWEEHGLFNNVTSVAMMDRSLTGGQSVNSSDQVEYTYELTKNAEA